MLEDAVQFKTLVAKYGSLYGAHSARVVCREVVVGESRANIITFYNDVYMPMMKSFVLELSPNSKTQPRLAESPMSTPVARKVPGTQNVFVSPILRPSPLTAVCYLLEVDM